jgi:putative redox protein
MTNVLVVHEEGDRFATTIRGHRIVVDQPVEDGGGDSGPTPTELFVASLASCVAFYAGRFLRRHNLSDEGLAVRATFHMSVDRPARVGSIRLEVEVPQLPASKQDAFLAVIDHCAVHNSMRTHPGVDIELDVAKLVA